MSVIFRILVFSDTHGDFDSAVKVIKNIVDTDLVLHAGDHASDAKRIQQVVPDIPVKYVGGNCDFGAYPDELVIEACGKKIFLAHGHRYCVKFDYDYKTILEKGKSLNCDCVVFGHTHISVCDVKDGITLLNPGSVKTSRSFGVIEIENGILKAAVCPI